MSRNAGLAFELTKRIEGITRSMNRVTYEALEMMIIRLDEVSPVGNPALWSDQKDALKKVRGGYHGGQFRGNWQLGVNQRPVGWLPGNIDPTGVETVAKNISAIPVMASRGYKFYLVNNAPYALALEEGHSGQVPHAFVYRIKREFNSIVRKVVEEVKAGGGRVR